MIKQLIPKKIKTKLKLMALAGDNVSCPLCGGNFITFLPFRVDPAPFRSNASCPGCGSLERTRIYWKYLATVKDFFSTPKKILHVAPEKKLFEKFSAIGNFEYCPIDKFAEGYSYPDGTLNMDVTDLKFPENSFDFILCSHVLEHVPDDARAMKELHRVLRPSGFGIIQVPMDLNLEKTLEDTGITDPSERIRLFGQHDHVRMYGRDYGIKLTNAGFKVEQNPYARNLDPEERFRYGFGDGEDLFIVRK